jgi:hypothetical protein
LAELLNVKVKGLLDLGDKRVLCGECEEGLECLRVQPLVHEAVVVDDELKLEGVLLLEALSDGFDTLDHVHKLVVD